MRTPGCRFIEGALLVGVLAAVMSSMAGRAQTAPSGKKLFEARCGGCHSLDRDKEGPRLRGVYGRAAANVSSFEYSEALKKSRIQWNEARLEEWLADPEQLVPGNDMSFRVPNAQERAAIIAYLKENSASAPGPE